MDFMIKQSCARATTYNSIETNYQVLQKFILTNQLHNSQTQPRHVRHSKKNSPHPARRSGCLGSRKRPLQTDQNRRNREPYEETIGRTKRSR